MTTEDLRKQHELLLSKWLHEDELINHRLTWLTVSQTLLFTVYSALYYAAATVHTAILQHPQADDRLHNANKLLARIEEVIHIVPFIGFWVSLLILIAVIAAVFAMGILKSQHNEAIQIPPAEIAKHFGWHRLGISDATTLFGLAPPVIIPMIFLYVWLKFLP